MKVLVCDRYTPESLARLQTSTRFECRKSKELQPTSDELAPTEALLIRSRTKIDENFLKRTPNLKIIITATSGFDHIDLDACKKRNVKVSFTPNANAQSAAEHALFLTLGALRKLTEIETAKSQKLWKDHLSPGNELYGKTVGLIGFGRVAKAFAKILNAFSCRILAYDPYVSPEEMQPYSAEKTNLTGVLKEPDIISLHAALTPVTKNIMSHSNFTEINSDAILINTARGPLINESDLIDALNHGHLKAAALDVFQTEPLPADSPLYLHKRVFWTPHLGALTEEALGKASDEAVAKLLEFTETQKLADELPHSLAWLSGCAAPL